MRRTIMLAAMLAASVPAAADLEPAGEYPVWAPAVLAHLWPAADGYGWRAEATADPAVVLISWDSGVQGRPPPSESDLAEVALPIFRAQCAEIIAGRHVAARDGVASPIVREDCHYDPPIPDAATCASIAADLRALGAARGSADAALAAAAAAADLATVRACAYEVVP